MTLADCIRIYFDQYLPHIKGAGEQTIASYRQAFTLFLKFAAKHYSRSVKKLQMQDLTSQLIFCFLNHLEAERKNCARSRNHRLAAIKSLAKMIRLLYPEYRHTAEMILNIPQKRCQKKLIGFLTHDETMQVFSVVDFKKHDGFRDYTILHLLYDSGARASEIANLKLDYFDAHQQTLAILGKANRYRIVELWPKTTQLLKTYIENYRPRPHVLHRNSLFLNQRRQALSRHGIYRICKKYLEKSFPQKRLLFINPAHSFRHACAVNMLLCGESLTTIKNQLGHENLNSTMIYLHMNLTKKKEVQKRFIQFTQSTIATDSKMDELLDWQNKEKTLNWLDSL
jgi:integrase/recombinase XerD